MADEKEKRDLRQEFTDKLVKSLEEGKIPWRKPWDASKSVAVGLPRNALTDKPYRGGNSLMLMMAGMDKGYADNRWLTFNQAKTLGGYILKGEKAMQVEFWEKRPFHQRNDVKLTANGKTFWVDPKAPETKDTVTSKSGASISKATVLVEHDGKKYTWRQAEASLDLLVQRTHYVFNVEQADGLKLPEIDRPAGNEIDQHERAENMVKGMMTDGLSVKHGVSDGAFYRPGADAVFMPPRDAFENVQGYYGTLLHELGHSTGHESRLNRSLMNSFGSQDYAKEELVAEITSAFTSMETGIPFDDENHKAYIQSWAETLKNDKNAIYVAARDASKAADYIMERGQNVERNMNMTTPAPVTELEAKNRELEGSLRTIWIRNGVPLERQEQLLAEISAKAQPGTQIGPFKIPDKPQRQQEPAGLER
jgi:antirestriction protein ArdC